MALVFFPGLALENLRFISLFDDKFNQLFKTVLKSIMIV